ncbi:MAG: FlgD immunoglobulin-like domain containing protein, partial [Limisphaerales bacterium]
SLPKPSRYIVQIYNLAGQIVKSFVGEAPAGNKTFKWDGTDQNGVPVSSGIYFYKAQTSGFSETKKMMLIK